MGADKLVELAVSVGLDREGAKAALSDQQALEDVTNKARYWRSKVKGEYIRIVLTVENLNS